MPTEFYLSMLKSLYRKYIHFVNNNNEFCNTLKTDEKRTGPYAILSPGMVLEEIFWHF